jgi:hypothetical protein
MSVVFCSANNLDSADFAERNTTPHVSRIDSDHADSPQPLLA